MNSLARRAILIVLPAAILAGYLLWAFLPSRTMLAGFGDDPAFNAWHFLWLFRCFDRLGPWAALSREVWNAPIFAPGELHLALSENQLVPALLMFPLWKLTGGLVLTLGIGLCILHLAAFFAAAGWLESRGVKELRFWGGLVFALCGWLQVQYAHWQNACIFVFPLALWAWERFRSKPDRPRLVLCALAFGWITGWNLYFSVMASYLLLALLIHAFFKRDVPRPRLFLLGALTLLVQLPLLWKYAELARQVGQFAAWDSYPATAWSWLGRFARPSLLEEKFHFWPRGQMPNIEAAGFVGMVWTLLAFASVIRRRARWPVFAAAIVYAISLGREHWLFDLFVLLPPVSALRAIGRFQIGVMVATLPAVFSLLEEWRGFWRALPIGLLLLELCPAGPALRVDIPPELDGPPTPLEQSLASSKSPLLVLNDVSAMAQLALVRTGVPIFEGYTGRPSPTGDLLFELAVRRRAPVADLLDLSGATRVLILDGWRLEEARRSPRLREHSCTYALGRPTCLFDATEAPPPEPLVRFGADTDLRIIPAANGVEVRLFARQGGRLAFDPLAGCRVFRVSVWPFLTSKRDIGIEGHSFSGIRFQPGALVYRKALQNEWGAWPAWMRPKLSAQVSCQGSG